MLKTGPKSVEIQDIQFKLKTRLKVFESSEGFATSQLCSLVACASRFGLLFVGTNTANIQAIQLKDIGNSQSDTSNYPRRSVTVSSPPTHLSLNCDHTILAVVVEKSGCCWVVFYDVKSFWRRDISVVNEIRLSATPGVQIVETKWNPAIGQCFTACKSDGSLGIYEIKDSSVDINELPSASGATCFSWSPKGKQIAVGSRDGQITQYKPDLKAVKIIGAPPSESYKLLALQWVSNYQFIGVYQSHNSSEQPTLLVVDAPKTGDPSFLNYYDICYSNGNTRPPQFYLILQPTWNILMVASSNSMEVGVLGNNNTSWIQWTMDDAARAELPLSLNRQETLPIGCDIDISSISPIPWGESTLPPAPILLLLSHYGVLCCFNIIYLKEGIPSICTPSDPITDTSGIQYFTNKPISAAPAISASTAGSVANTGKFLSLPKSPITKDVAQPLISATTTQHTVSITPKKPIELFSGQSILTPISADSKLSSNQYPLKYQSLYPPLGDNSENLLLSTKASPANISNTPTSTKLVPTGLSTVPSQPPAITPEPEIRKELTTVSNDTLTDEETEKLLGQMVRDECIFLESELKAVLHQGKLLKINLGTDDDKTAIVGSTAMLEEFFKEMTDICSSQNTEVHILNQNLLQSWAWYEEIKSLQVTSKNESMRVLLKAQPLDPASEKRLDDIQHAKYYLESQITQAHRALDEQWEIFQDYCKKTNRIQIPTMEMIFQTMVKQTAILRKEKYILKDIASRLKSKTRPSVGPSLLSSINDAQELSEELERLRMNPEDIHQIHYDRIRNRTKNFTKKHGNDLRSFLKKRDISHIAVVKPQLSTSILQSPSSKLKHLSTTSKTLISNTTQNVEKVAKKIDFVASTPKTMISSTATASESLPLQNLQNLTLRLETPHFNKMSSLSSKGVVAGSPNSAFASTAVTSTSAPTLISFKPVAFSAPSSQSNKQLPTYAIATTVSTSNQPVITIGKPFSFGKSPGAAVVTTVTSTSGITTATTKSGFTFSFQANEFLKGQQNSTIGTNLAPKTTTSFSVLNLTVSTKPSTSVVQTTSFTASPIVPSATTSIFGGSSLKLNDQQITNVSSTIKTPPSFAVSQSKPIYSPTVTTSTAPNEISSLKPLQPNISIASQPSAFGSSGSSIFGNAAITTASFFTPATTKPIVLTPLTTANQELSSSSVPLFNIASATTTPAAPNVINFASTAVGATQSSFKSPINSTDIATSNLTGGNSITITKSPLNVNEISVGATTPVATKTLSISTKTPTKPSATTTPEQSTISVTPITSGFNPAATSISNTLTPAVAIVVSTTPVEHTSLASTTTDVNNSSLSLSVTSLATSIFSTPSADTSSGVVQPSPTSKLFGSSTGSLFSTTTASSPLFTSSTVSAAPFFGSVSTTSSSVFGNMATTKSSIFGNVTTEPSSFANSTSSTVFGNSAPSIFASTTATSTFGNVSSSTPAAFDNVMSTQASSFGTFSTKPSIFGTSSSAPISTQSSMFGNSNQSSIFGNTSTTTTQSVFEPPKTTQSIFGQSTFGAANASPFGGNSVFGGSATFGQSSGSLFGNTTTTTTSANIFGNTPTTNSTFGSSSVFGTATTSAPFGSSGPFSSSPQQSFPNTSVGAFGFGSLNVGSTSAASSSVFGSTSSNPFAASDNKSVFGASTSSNSSVFGGSAGNNNSTAFGSSQSQGFGSGGFTSGQSIFGQQAAPSFGSSTFGQQAPGPFSGGGGSIAQSGFGASSTFQKPTNFGASAGFGGAASFGSSPSFGGAPTFGSTASFGGSPSKVFGSPTSGFPQSQQPAGFGNLADQPTVGFGNLAQQTTNQNANTPFSGNSSFSSWR